MKKEIKTEIVVLGGGPGGYAAAFRAADLGKKVVLVEQYEAIGGVCLHVGCIPSKSLLHIAKIIDDISNMQSFGVDFGKSDLDVRKICEWKEGVIKKLAIGLKVLARDRNIELITGYGKFDSLHELSLVGTRDVVHFEQAVVAVGSRPIKLPYVPKDPRIMNSTDALELQDVKGNLLIIGAGIIGLEMATIYHALGGKISIVEQTDRIIPGADADVVQPLYQCIQKNYEEILLKTTIREIVPKEDGLYVTFDDDSKTVSKRTKKYDRILVAVGRCPNSGSIDVKKAGIRIDDRGFISVDNQMRTNVSHIYAVGDVVGQPMLAHKATYEGRLAAEVISNKRYYNDARCIPVVAYTNPEVAWVGLTENEASSTNIRYNKSIFPWSANGRVLSLGRSTGFTKLLFDESGTIIGGGVVGINAGDLISEIALAIEMGCNAGDVALTIHPHPTLSETIKSSCEVFEGTVTDLFSKRV
ncbi:dihydrolipoyl dehydrogenase [Coxiella endosymbiont of Amblyomma sculptum]|uniref:dihydrolipoyl dehydrogenase n=1 Tax=Coxiella endosymbiont of Amblyomma sculptum TaxID=2487929 RepID=UPI00132EB280|nr:dihydrolipoyl dehydrogenase [Coxiella endosymbiont of Amblyomma sculptum]QHG92714.1 dihydrolipoyl dehydrogenase [Coxiella endosymbiont of Amblyomma sculptum]